MPNPTYTKSLIATGKLNNTKDQLVYSEVVNEVEVEKYIDILKCFDAFDTNEDLQITIYSRATVDVEPD